MGVWKSSRGRYNTKTKRMTANTLEKQSPNGKRRLKSWMTVKKCAGSRLHPGKRCDVPEDNSGHMEGSSQLTDIRPAFGPRLRPEVQTQADDDRHAGDFLPSSPTVLVEDVDLLRFEGQCGLNPHHATRPAG